MTVISFTYLISPDAYMSKVKMNRVKPRQNIVISYQGTEPIIQMYVPSGPKIDYLYGRKKVGVKA